MESRDAGGIPYGVTASLLTCHGFIERLRFFVISNCRIILDSDGAWEYYKIINFKIMEVNTMQKKAYIKPQVSKKGATVVINSMACSSGGSGRSHCLRA